MKQTLFIAATCAQAQSRKVILAAILVLHAWGLHAQILSETPTALDLSNASIYVDLNDFTVVKKSAELLSRDIEKVTGKKVKVVHTPATGSLIVIGSAEKSAWIRQLVKAGKIKVGSGWEEYNISTLKEAKNNLLVIAGSDRRGTAYGVFELSRQIGVSPWYWWADVPVKSKAHLYVSAHVNITDAPKVKYRGIFINDEAPALSGWSREKFGGFNSKFYAHVFELMLRLKSNYIWPAMWGSAYYDDDPLNVQLADDYAIVIGTSHHEPLDRAHDEWRRYGQGAWNYEQNKENLQKFWREGFRRSWNEKVTTVGMRGDGDEPMSRETATELLEKIVSDQRKIIEEVSGKPAAESPQMWALYKEVQDYYDKGMRVPDDVTLLLCDDNWGNIRKLPAPGTAPRKGGYGIYYHYDYVGGPRNHKWINNTQLIRVWEQMNLAYRHGVKDIWIVNVGDIKPMEYPISFWCDFAWNPDRIKAEDVRAYTENWAAGQFGETEAPAIAEILTLYTKYNSRRKPELLDARTYSLENYNEFERVTKEYAALLEKAGNISKRLDKKYHDAYFQLVLHPVKAMANLYDLYYQVALNQRAFEKGELSANRYADAARKAFKKDSLITVEYHTLNNGKWNRMMSQTHIGYTSWQEPRRNIMPKVSYLEQGITAEPAAAVPLPVTPRPGTLPPGVTGKAFYEQDGYVSIHAQNFSRAIEENGIRWQILPDLGKSEDAVTTLPPDAAPQVPGGNSPRLEYDIYTGSEGILELTAYFSPSLNFHFTEQGLQYAVSVDDEAPQIISLNKEDKDSISGIWNRWVAEGVIKKTSRHTLTGKGKHTVKYWMVNSGVVLQKLVADFGGVKPSYLGPPQTLFKK
ncbi:glycosyl hydrolase 115 family protein [Leadbetterella sp. DM7]|uniref:glycosyl hydrolase 115 family protein n=1 Tax=Leadbetterella sp. DM7 TaxID=3235085 RepID=UPI00349EBA05